MLTPIAPIKANDNHFPAPDTAIKRIVDGVIAKSQSQVLNSLLWSFNQTTGCEKAAQMVKVMMTTLQLKEEVRGE